MLKNLRKVLEIEKRQNKIKQDKKKLAHTINAVVSKDEKEFDKFKIPYYEWTMQFRHFVEGKPNILECLPMWHDIYRDTTPVIVELFCRQVGKTTHGGGLLAYYGTQLHTKGVYVTFEEESLRMFSNDKYRGSLIHPDNRELFDVVKGAESGKGAVSRVEFKTGSSTSLVTDANEFHHVIGKSADFIFYDECQNLDLSSLAHAQEAQSWTKGKELYAGIGGLIGTDYHKLWLSTNQMEWIFDNPDWYDDMVKNPIYWDEKGFVWNIELKKLLAGRWEPKAPENWSRHGYHLSQDMFPNMPRTKEHAIQLYKVSEKLSLEYKRIKYPSSYYQQNVLANFIKGQTKPFSKESLMKCFFKTKSFVNPEQVDHKKGKVYASADWGGGNTAFTIPLITQCLDENGPIFRVLYIERIDEQDVEKQADIFINLCNAYEVDHIAIDAGGGPRQAQKVETTFADRCTKISYIVRPDMPLPRENEKEVQYRENRFSIDRTYSLDRLKDLIDHPHYVKGQPMARWIIPASDPEKIMWIIEHFEAVEGEIKKLKSTGQDYINYIHAPGHPDDAVHSFNYNWIAQMIDKGSDIYIKSF